MQDYMIFVYVGVPVLVLYFWYVSIISKRNKAQESYSGIDIQLKKRTDLVPNILKIAQKFMDHEKLLLTEITELRTKVLKASESQNNEERFKLEGMLENKMSGLMVAVENYPDLKSQESMVEAQRVYADVEEHISAARRSYNASVTALHNAIQIFPGTILAAMLGVKPMAFFEASEADKKDVNASDYLK
tara:strand:+ start:119666 stop:120232 length:567 start_codon:yes stop_codon:yes gene_type:complete